MPEDTHGFGVIIGLSQLHIVCKVIALQGFNAARNGGWVFQQRMGSYRFLGHLVPF